MEVYFDNSATTKISSGAKAKMNEVMELHFGNPSSLHKIGLDAEHILNDARAIILNALGINRGVRGELIFTSGGTESNNIAIFGSVFAKARQNNEVILTTDSEHSSVSAPLEYLEKKGFKIIRVPTKQGELDLDFIKSNAKCVILATFMHVNNETGAVYNLPEAFKIVKDVSPNAITHADCVQSFMKVKYTKKSLGADLISISAHKINGAKGVGALYIAPEIIKQKKVVPLFLGGGQEESFRSGTENVYGIAAFGEATKEHFANIDTEIDKMSSIRNYLIENLKTVDGVSLNLPKNSAPHILNMSIIGVRSEIALHDLSSKLIYVSSGSACSSNAPKKTHNPLTAFGLDTKMADSAIRVSLCPDNTVDEAEYFIKCIKETISKRAKR